MKKYWQIFKISFAQEFAYKFNFVMWRVRNVMQLLLIFFLWNTVFTGGSVSFFGYDKEKILTYVFGILVLRALVLSARAVDVSEEISKGDILNSLLKPMNYFKFWLTRDLSSKVLNLIFAAVEFTILFWLLRPSFFFQTNPIFLTGFVVSVLLAIFLYFCILFIVNMVPFWAPYMGWGAQFLVTVVIVEFFSGALFPIDILPQGIQSVLYLTPFPYLIFIPIQIYLGKISFVFALKGILIALMWSLGLAYLMNFLWNKGLRAYEAVGR